MYFDVNPDTEDGYRVRREPSARSGRSSMPC